MDRLQQGVFHAGQLASAIDWLQKCEIDSTPLLDAMAGNVASIDRLSQLLLTHSVDYQAAKVCRDRRRASKSKTTTAAEAGGQSMGLVRGEGRLPQSVIGFLITLMIEACVRVGAAPPAAFAQLIRAHLGADTFAAQDLKAPDAFDKAVQYKLAYPDASQDEIARHAGVSRPRVSQWMKDGNLDRAVERLGRLAGVVELIRGETPRA